MTGFQAIIDTRNLAVSTDITGKDTPDSIDPADVGNNINTNLEVLKPFMDAINAFTFYSGASIPIDALGVENDVYIQTNGGVSLVIWRKTTLTWVEETTVVLGISYNDGIIIGLRTQIDIPSTSVSVTAGNWAIDNVIYGKSTPTFLTYDAPEVGSNRIDTIYATTAGTILYLAGAPSGSPVKPNLPANTIEVDSIYVPALGTGDAYLFSSGTANAIPTNPSISATEADLVDDGGGGLYLPTTLPSGFVPASYAIINRSGTTTYEPVSLTPDGLAFTGFTDNSPQTITIKLI